MRDHIVSGWADSQMQIYSVGSIMTETGESDISNNDPKIYFSLQGIHLKCTLPVSHMQELYNFFF